MIWIIEPNKSNYEAPWLIMKIRTYGVLSHLSLYTTNYKQIKTKTFFRKHVSPRLSMSCPWIQSVLVFSYDDRF